MVMAVGVANAQNCSTTITACGCTIASAGTYAVANDLNASQGLTSRGSCIDINTTNVKLFTNGFNIIGAGTGTGTGIHVLNTANNALLEASGPEAQYTYTTLSGWQYGLESEADNVMIDAYYFDGNTTGVWLRNAANNHLTYFDASGNTTYGAWIRGGSGNSIDNAYLGNNGVAGLYVGCSTTGPTGTRCTGFGNTSSGNFISFAGSEAGGPPQSYGIALESGSTGNTVADTAFVGNTADDFWDGSTTAVNVWRVNSFTTANRSYIH